MAVSAPKLLFIFGLKVSENFKRFTYFEFHPELARLLLVISGFTKSFLNIFLNARSQPSAFFKQMPADKNISMLLFLLLYLT